MSRSSKLTPLGHTLLPVLAHLKKWAEEHMSDVDEAREAYDLRD